MSWVSIRENNLLEIVRKTADGEEFLRKQYYERSKHVSWVLLGLEDPDIEITIKPYTLERLENEIEEEYEDEIIKRLFVGIQNKEHICYIGKAWVPKQTKDEKYVQYYFENNQPRNHWNGKNFKIGWPQDRPIEIDNRLNCYFESLMSLRPKVVGSLSACLIWLAAPGPEYGKVKVIPFQLKK